MGVYNGEKYLEEAIASILQQTYKDLEFIIINDGSTDRSRHIIKNFDDNRIIYIEQQNIGLTRTLNRGLNVAKGEFIARMDADEISLPMRLEKQVDFLVHNKNIGAVGSSYYRIDAQGHVIGSEILKVPKQREAIYRELFKWCFMLHGSTMIRKTALDVVGPYDENIIYSQDYDLWFRLLEHFDLDVLPEPLFCWRLHHDSIYSTKQNTASHYCDLVRRLSVLRRQMPSSEYARTYERELISLKTRVATHSNVRRHRLDSELSYRYHLAAAHFRYGSRSKARIAFWDFLRRKPFFVSAWLYLGLSFIPRQLTNRLLDIKRRTVAMRNLHRALRFHRTEN